MMKLKNIILVLGLAATSVVQQSMPAKALTAGTSITGSINFGGGSTNYYDPVNGGVPTGQGYENASDAYNSATVPLSNSTVEFGYQDPANIPPSSRTQSDPESYSMMYKEFPGMIKAIWIRIVSGVDPEEEKSKNSPERFEKAFKRVPREVWRTFSDVRELDGLAERLVSS